MSTVDKVIKICKERKIPISKLEKDLGFGNGYISGLRKGTLPDDRLVKISNYLQVSISQLTGEEQKEKPAPIAENEHVDLQTQKLLEAVKDMSPAEMAILFEKIEKIKEIRI